MKMRTLVEEVEAMQMGALPQIMGFSGLYQALQAGVVDGQEKPTPTSTRPRCKPARQWNTTS